VYKLNLYVKFIIQGTVEYVTTSVKYYSDDERRELDSDLNSFYIESDNLKSVMDLALHTSYLEFFQSGKFDSPTFRRVHDVKIFYGNGVLTKIFIICSAGVEQNLETLVV